MTEEEIRFKAIEFAKKNKVRIAKELTDTKKYIPDNVPVSVFMAGSPGAGKTEFSKILIDTFEQGKRYVIRIDGDELRPLFSEYTGNNSSLFHGAVSLITEKIHDLVLHNKQSFIFDSTFSKYQKAVKNIERSLSKSRPVYIIYIYQKPEIAWKFTQAREVEEGRNIPKDAFVENFLGARKTVEDISEKFKNKVTIFLLKRDFDKNIVENYHHITKGKEQIDQLLGVEYNRKTLEQLL